MSHWVFAYGSNMHLSDLRCFAGRHGYREALVLQAEPGVLVDYELAWNYYSRGRQGGAANVRPVAVEARSESRAEVWGAALRINDEMLRVMDRKEGHPERYARSERELLLSDGRSLWAWVYEVQPAYRRCQFVPPRRAYLQLLIVAAEEHGLPDRYIEQLRRTATAD